MTSERGTPESTVARLTVAADAALLPAALGFVRGVAGRLGVEDAAAEGLGRTVEAVLRNVVEHAFGPGERGELAIEVLRRPGQVVVAVEDRGLPADYAFLPGDAAGVRFVNLGREGNRVEILEHVSGGGVGEPPGMEPRPVPTTVPDEAGFEIRMMRPEESLELSRCVYRSYGYSYDWDHIYYPDRIRELQEGGLMRSCVAVTEAGEFVGHLAARMERPGSPVAEAGQAVVDPRFRGHRLFERMKTYLAERARGWGMYGLYSEATAVHPYSQRGNLRVGAAETGYLLGFIPATVLYRDIHEGGEGRRGSVALFYMRTNPEPERAIYPPEAYAEAVWRVVGHNGLRRDPGDAPGTAMPAVSRMSVDVRRDHNVAFLRVEEPGADLREVVRERLRGLCLHRVDCIYIDLPLSHPATREAAARLDGLGFFFGGVVPELRDGDVLRLQYLNEVEILPEDVKTGSEFGQGLVRGIFEQKEAVER